MFLEKKDELLSEVYAVIEKSGFKVNHNKTRISYRDSRQEVTGLVVNNKISVKREYYKKTRSMLDHLYRGIPVEHNGVELTQKQIEGRLAFINQIDWYNNIQENRKKSHQNGLNARERQYQQFLFFKYFFNSEKPTIVTEGKTDIIYVRAALQNLYTKYPKLIKKKEDGSFEYSISFLNRTKRLKFFLGIHQDGANMMKNIYNGYTGKNNFPNLFESLSKHKLRPRNPIILLFDNETKSNRPLKDFLNYTHKSLETNIVLHLVQILYLVTIPLVKEKQECEIEDLFDDEVLSHEIDGKTFDRKGNKGNKYYSKQIFASYIAKNMHSIDFKVFIPLLDAINQIITEFKP